MISPSATQDRVLRTLYKGGFPPEDAFKEKKTFIQILPQMKALCKLCQILRSYEDGEAH